MTPQHHQSTSKKRLLSAHQKPKQVQKPGTGQPIIPPDDQLLIPPKKTRDLPNLSDCHGCNLRINHTNPKDRLQILDSVWRIVLLCRKCIKRVECGQTCSYCFKDSANADCFKCQDCERLIHENCVSKHGNSPPWSHFESELGLGFTVCVDCWVPKMFRKSIRIRRKKKKSWEGSRKASSEDFKGLKSGVITDMDMDCLTGEEIVLALKANRKGFTKAQVRRHAAGAANIIAIKHKGGKKIKGLDISNGAEGAKCGENTSGSKVVGDAELAFQLHRSMNSSSRKFRNSRLLDTDCLDAFPNSRDENGSRIEVGWLKPGLITYKRRKWNKLLITYKRGCLRRKKFLENADVGPSVVGNDSGSHIKMNSDPCCTQQDELNCGPFNVGAVTFSLECDDNGFKQRAICSEKNDRYSIKYSRRPKGSKSQFSCDIKKTNGTFLNIYQASAPEVPMNCSIQSRTSSDASLNSYAVDLQSDGCDVVHQEESP